MLTLLSAVMSTLSAQFHVQGTSLGRDIYETIFGKKEEMNSSYLGIVKQMQKLLKLAYKDGFKSLEANSSFKIVNKTSLI